MSQPDILKLTQEALAQCDENMLDKTEKVVDAIGGLFEALAPEKTVKARMLVMVFRQCVVDEKTRRNTSDKKETPASK